jgi:hypothetical protein
MDKLVHIGSGFMRKITNRGRLVLAFVIFVAVGTVVLVAAAAGTQNSAVETENGQANSPAAALQDSSASNDQAIQFGSGIKSKPVFAYYYLWWTNNQWTSHLGANYPYNDQPNPLPATLDSSSCGTVNNYNGNVMTDVSQNLAYDQTNPTTITDDISTAAKAGLSGFAANWDGSGTTPQTANYANNLRLANVFQSVAAINSQGYNFKIILNYKSSATTRTADQFDADLNYLYDTYASSPNLDHTWSSKPEIIISGSWKYDDAFLTQLAQDFAGKFYIIGDEKPSTWDATRAADLSGTTYYWSSQNPYTNAASFSQLQDFAATIRSTKNSDGSDKLWLAPFAPGYNAMLLYGTTTCVPRNNGQTMHALFDGNLASNPDGWAFISWNEISEGTYIVPLSRYGDKYVKYLTNVIDNNR